MGSKVELVLHRLSEGDWKISNHSITRYNKLLGDVHTCALGSSISTRVRRSALLFELVKSCQSDLRAAVCSSNRGRFEVQLAWIKNLA